MRPLSSPCEREPSEGDDGYSSTRARRYTTILDMFPHESRHVRLRRRSMAGRFLYLSSCRRASVPIFFMQRATPPLMSRLINEDDRRE